MNSVVKSFPLLILFSELNSCTVEKRRYSSGYYFEWSGKMARMEKPSGSGTVNSRKDSNDSESFTVTASMDAEPAMVPQVGTLQEMRDQQARMEYSEKAFASTVQKETFPSKKQITSTDNQKSISPVPPHEEPPRTQGPAIASLVLGILSVVPLWG